MFMQAARLPAAFSGIRMADETITTTGIAAHGASRLPSVEIDSFNIELKDEEGFLGDRASKGAFRDILEKWRKPLRKSGEDPFGKEPSENISKKVLDAILVGNDTEASAVAHSAIENSVRGARTGCQAGDNARRERSSRAGGPAPCPMSEPSIDVGSRGSARRRVAANVDS